MYYTGMVTEETHQTCSDEECSSLRSHKLHGGDSSTRAPGVASLSISLFQLAILSSRPLAHCCLKFRHLPRQTLHILHRRRGPIARPLLPPTTSLDQDPATPSIACISIGKVVGDSNVPEQTFLGLSNNAFYPVDPCLNGNKLVHSELKQYVSKNDFSAAATTEKGCVAVASNKDDPRLFDHLGINAKTALPALPALRTVPGADNLEHTHTMTSILSSQKDGRYFPPQRAAIPARWENSSPSPSNKASKRNPTSKPHNSTSPSPCNLTGSSRGRVLDERTGSWCGVEGDCPGEEELCMSYLQRSKEMFCCQLHGYVDRSATHAEVRRQQSHSADVLTKAQILGIEIRALEKLHRVLRAILDIDATDAYDFWVIAGDETAGPSYCEGIDIDAAAIAEFVPTLTCS
ncbi:uncharacterized protein MYCGRDRAFT_97624 [Zymoseptoria tritici IPO323]|uniref:Vacuolar import/degradation Vid27 C-terminal domain-containing protein n=1 Tax=Zymoseptoria tritici (strain CBS 115943 / IPO323) TaxID=336722 RepID=F9XR21_ZYMTI|nr:uncharacterized protein MYCGRDRAFT_97624 [Zymoseptoria tritici IPO323]EGP82286.1 hypothetical protein MYCGRDRAFT_97624 [Zymoseptoria tritici IPO323]